MMLPFALVGIFSTLVGYLVASTSSRDSSRVVSGQSATPRTRDASRRAASPSFVKIFWKLVENGESPSEALANAAIKEACSRKQWEMAEAITETMDGQLLSESKPEDAPSEEKQEEKQEEKKTDDLNPTSPITGIDDSDWKDFVSGMKTEDPSFETETHKGAFHHHKRRLEQLGIKDTSTLEAQYNALVADVLDLRDKYSSLLGKHVTEPVEVGDGVQLITASGMLGLLKAAGPRGAEKWIADKEQKSKFPKTTEIFLRTNGLF